MTVFSTRILPEAGLQLLKEAGISITQWQQKRELTQEELMENCKQHDALISAGRNKLDKVSKIKLRYVYFLPSTTST